MLLGSGGQSSQNAKAAASKTNVVSELEAFGMQSAQPVATAANEPEGQALSTTEVGGTGGGWDEDDDDIDID